MRAEPVPVEGLRGVIRSVRTLAEDRSGTRPGGEGVHGAEEAGEASARRVVVRRDRGLEPG